MSAVAPHFDNRFAGLGERFYSRLPPTPVAQPKLIRINAALARELGIDPDWLASEEGVATVAGNSVPAGAEPLAAVYAGHQFGSWNPRLGDGRALLLGEVLDAQGRRWDIQLKGSGPTPYSRGGDGRAPLGPVLREYLVSEAMATLGIATTRALAAVTTGEAVYRDTVLPGAVLARVAQSHIRIGSLEYFAARQDEQALRLLADHVIERHYPAAAGADNPYLALFDGVVARQAELIAQWQLCGFIHGVMNTDNMLLSGETVDYGPCAFMDFFDPDSVYSSIDRGGRYAYSRQPAIAHWNLMCLAQALLPLFGADREAAVTDAGEVLDSFAERFAAAHQAGLNRKLGLVGGGADAVRLGADLFRLMAAERSDFTLTFRRLAEIANPDHEKELSQLFELPAAYSDWLQQWQALLRADDHDDRGSRAGMLATNPVFIPRNHLVEEAISAAVGQADFEPFHRLVDILAQPCRYDPENVRYARPPQPEQVVTATFCGT
ncbi:MAG: YdiU family protein [Xanthomonadales bacterium]|nr:YdiU family protein [Xanthomonadales bacterium]